MNTPLSDVVSNQYERWMYPQPILDLRGWLQNNWQWFDPSHAHSIFWPDRSYKPGMDILVAGCGTNQAAVYAYTNPDAQVTAIDVSQPSLDHHQYLKDKYKLKNLDLHLLPIENIASLNRTFDLIVSTGVLHHLASPEVGMSALAQCLNQDGVIALMLYAKYGRIGVEILQSVVRDLGLRQNDTSVLMVRDMLDILPKNHPISSYLKIAPDLQFDAGLVDTFLHGRDRSYCIKECIELVESAELAFQDMFLKSPYYPPTDSSSAFYWSVAALPEAEQWSIMERVNFSNACHFFTACRKDRPTHTYKIDFDSDAFDHYVPTLRYRCSIKDNVLSRHNWKTSLNPFETHFVRSIDGQRSVSQIIAKLAQESEFVTQTSEEIAKQGKALFRRLWQLDFVAMTWNHSTSATDSI